MNPTQPISASARQGFSLLEVIIATAILAGSAMVLVSMIGAGSRYGRLAEQRTLALAAASSLIDELIATNQWTRFNQETTGVYGTTDPLGYRIRVSDFSPQTENQSEPIPGLQQITVEVFPGEVQVADDGQKMLCSLIRIVRISGRNQSVSTAQMASEPN